jgi:folylpolyglutamate synthase
MAFHIFKQLNVSVSVIEVGIGGEYDATNIIPNPVVSAITSLGLDHQGILGNTVEEIAWHKSGVFKEGCDAVYIQQKEDSVMDVIEDRAAEKKVCYHSPL